MLFLTIIIALLFDRLFGEPKSFHPLVGFGNLAHWIEKKYNAKKKPILAGISGTISAITLVLLPTFAAYGIQLSASSILVTFIFDAAVLYWAIGNRSLREHILDVRLALENSSIENARVKLSKIVSRDVDDSNREDIIRGAIETNLENGSDAVFAPIFWYCCLGAPGVVLYRLGNTLDAMWGYRTERFEYFGKFSAILDDILNYIPARLVALSYAIIGNTQLAISCWKSQASLLSSPNAGPVMTSGAGSLDVQLGGPTRYHQKIVQKPYFGSTKTVTLTDIDRSLSLVLKVVALWCACIFAVQVVS